ncbi:NAD(P)/FAD-dependent oxidoreductase [Egicoccus halophilus]|uniref:Pyridine nucleotide-disulfide oxidoreductase n=1 Tax=Egicoccus halophilus TaxID=1670830 RepID=A0A8J3EX71_9ACTN|nr:NAD(P)/FAD-dependent oxidoreductase [Egicoccus halophilus]GGI05172.1 pyridine nucleotide-disulfide oxidoreductase [Egicoccus halophilus]
MSAPPTGTPVPALPDQVDVVVVGGGPAGASAATWLGRYRRRTLLVDAGEPRNRWVDQVNGIPGLDPIPPDDLQQRLRQGLTRYPHVTRLEGRVVELVGDPDAKDDCRFVATLDDGRQVATRRVVLATGVRDAFPALERFEEHYGADVFHCPSCEGFDARDKPVVVLGWGPHVPAFASELLDWASSVTIVTDGPSPQVSAEQLDACTRLGMDFVTDDPAEELLGTRGSLQGVRLASGRVVAAGMVFFSIAHDADLSLASSLGCEVDAEGVLVADAEGQTTVPGVYAAGDVTHGMQLVAVAIGKGTTAGVACAKSLHGDTTSPESPSSAPDASPLVPADQDDEEPDVTPRA